ncbi:MAG: ABC transporter ATP-binding protein, partial [Pseudomonadota bacterium]|nr:ABC transporter ATP-binding protein [Pseudomonadota bacterium]
MTPPALLPDIAPQAARADQPLLSVRGLSTRFATSDGVLQAIEAVDLDVLRGECLGVVGESGSGKSVTFASVMGLIKPPGKITAGSVRLDGVELMQLNGAALRRLRGRQIAMTMQDALTALNPVMTIETQLCEVIRAHDDDVARLVRRQRARAARERAVEMMALVGIQSPRQRLGDYPHQFSGGMRQRIMMAIALAGRPRLLIADEPTTALDVTVQAQILELIAGLRARSGMSVVLITHDLAVVAEQCDRIVVMYAGQVMESGRIFFFFWETSDIYTRGLLASIPRADDPSVPIRPIPGTLPSLIDPPAQCRFYSRCERRQPE